MHVPYTADVPRRVRSREELRATIPGWGADLDPAMRPSVPRERSDLETGAHWDVPVPQPDTGGREKSVEHAMMTPVFGTVAPLHGISGAIRRIAYERYSEGRAAHWLLLILGDRADAIGSHFRSFLTLRPDNPITETGVLAELKYNGIRSRRGRGRVDLKHAWLDPILIAGPFFLGGLVVFRVVRRMRKG
jgi:hypothetical protein